MAGAGGFINISQNAHKVVFAGTFTAGGLTTEILDGQLAIKTEGRSAKFVSEVEQITFTAVQAAKLGTEVLFVTERAVFQLLNSKVWLKEIAPGIDVERDILAHMNFVPEMGTPNLMDYRLFQEGKFGLDEILFDLHLEDRIVFDESNNRLYLNFENLRLRSDADIDLMRQIVLSRVETLGRRADGWT